MKMKFNDSTKLAIMTLTVKECSAFDPLTTSIGVLKEGSHLWRHVLSIFIEYSKRRDEKVANKANENTSESGHIGQMSRKLQPKKSTPIQNELRWFYCNKKWV